MLEAPGVPGTPILIVRTAHSITVRTTRGSGGLPSLYRFRVSLDDVITDTDFMATSASRTVRFSTLDPGTDYWVDVRAENSAGESVYSDYLMTATLAVMPPGVPTTPTLVSRTHNSITVETTPGAGGSPALYRWRYSIDSAITDVDPEVVSRGPASRSRGYRRSRITGLM